MLIEWIIFPIKTLGRVKKDTICLYASVNLDLVRITLLGWENLGSMALVVVLYSIPHLAVRSRSLYGSSPPPKIFVFYD